MTASANSPAYRITAAPSAQRPGTVEIIITREGLLAELAPETAERYQNLGGRLPADFPASLPVAELTVPDCDPDQARAMAAAWLAIHGHALGDVDFEWGPRITVAEASDVHRYAPARRRRRLLRRTV